MPRERGASRGELIWIGRRGPRVKLTAGSQAPTSPGEMEAIDEVELDPSGLIGDRYRRSSGDRAVTLLQYEHLAVISSLLGRTATPKALRRNLVVAGINLQLLKRGLFRVGAAILAGTGDCHPCNRMNETLGSGGYQATRGHGGITARVIAGGSIHRADLVEVVSDAEAQALGITASPLS